MIKKTVLYILAGLFIFTFLFYLVFFFTLSEDTITGELNRLIGEVGYELRAKEISKSLPLSITLEDVSLSGAGGDEMVTFSRIGLRFRFLEFFGGLPIDVTLFDGQQNQLRAGISRRLDSLRLTGTDFAFSPVKRKNLPAFLARQLNFDIKKIEMGEGGTLSLSGNGTFDFDHVTVAGQYGMDVTVTGLEGRVIFRNESLYIKGGTATLLSSTFDFEGTVSRFHKPSGSALDLEARGRKISPLVANLLKLQPENEYNVKIRIRGNLNSPQITVMKR